MTLTLRRAADALRSAFQGKAGLLRALLIAAALVALFAAAPNAAQACGITDPLSCVALIFAKIFQLLTALMGWILVLEVEAVIRVAQYVNFVSPGPAAVRIGWLVTRDLANMFFIVILLVIAFGTILGSSTYSYEKNLPRLLIMAVVINFSKTICGIFIDMGQVVMMTFVNGFKEAAAGNFMNAYQINKLVALGQSESGTYDFGLVIAMMFAFILAAIAVCVTLVLLVTLLFRVVMLWVLIILSPIAFLSSAIPRGGDYYADWWKEFRKYIITGPVIAFFMWLALASVQTAGQRGFAGEGFLAPYAGTGESDAALGQAQSRILTEAGRADTIMNMIIAISIMLAGLKYAEKSGVAGLGAAKAIRNVATKAARNVATYGAKRAAEPLLTAGGRQLAKVPLVGGLGRAAVLTGEKWKGDRIKKSEARFGGAEDLARLSPGAFNRSLGSLASKASMGKLDDIDKKRMSSMMDIGLKNPALAAALGESGIGHQALNAMIQGSSGKSLQDAAGIMMSDKNAKSWAKADPDLLKSAYEKLQQEAKTDPNLKKTVGEFETKFAPQLIKNGMMDAGRLKELAPKMSNDDVMGLGKDDMATFMPYLNSSQMRKLAQDGTEAQQGSMLEALSGMNINDRRDTLSKLGTNDVPKEWYANQEVANFLLDRTKGDAKARGDLLAKDTSGALATAARQRLEKAMSGRPIPRSDGSIAYDVDVDEVLASLPDAINVGSISADKILGDSALQGYISNNAGKVDLASLAKNSNAGSREAAMALAASVIHADPSRAGRMRGEMYQDIRPDEAMMKRVSGEEKAAEVTEALGGYIKALDDAKRELSSLQDLATTPGGSTAGSQAAAERLARAIENLERSGKAHDAAQKEKSAIEVKLKSTPVSDTAGTAALKKSLAEIEKTIEKTQQEIIKGMAALKKG